MPKKCIYSACICCYNQCDVGDILAGCEESGSCLCLQGEACCALNGKSKGMGCVEKEQGDIVKFALPCCLCAVIKPSVCCAATNKCLCIEGAAAFPLGGPVPKPVCAVCFIKCLPGPPGFMQPYEAGAASAAVVPEKMER
eukprot:g6991.t1